MTGKTIEDLELVVSKGFRITRYMVPTPSYFVEIWFNKANLGEGHAPTLSAAIEQAIGEGEET